MNPVKIGILLGSDSDFDTSKAALGILDDFGIPWEIHVLSAHRNPKGVHEYAARAHERGIQVIICAAGMAAALAGTVAAMTPLPVIGVPMAGSSLSGMDALYATVQMPTGVPVATMSIGSAGAKNAAIFAAQILGLQDSEVRARVVAYKQGLDASVQEKNRRVQEQVQKLKAARTAGA